MYASKDCLREKITQQAKNSWIYFPHVINAAKQRLLAGKDNKKNISCSIICKPSLSWLQMMKTID